MNSQPSLVEHEDHWDLLPLVGRAVTRCLVDHAFGLQFWSPEAEIELRIEGPFTLREAGGEELSLVPEETTSLGPALRLFRREVSSARAHKDGRLEVIFTDGSTLSVGPDQKYEAWELTGSGQRLVSTPGGDLAVWL
jgi:Family of unknown function (DUF6188)